ncbi:MAG: DUF262 domain-containing protein [Formivibrio sp.]|nr:DUF262 domain-containing protein [Formivibrio sp.]
MNIIEAIDHQIGEVRTESIDMSVGEIISLHKQQEIIIQPDFQRLFRWSWQQRSRLVESLLLELPIPSIFLIEKENGVLELIDGLQRVSSLLHFIDPDSLNQAPQHANLDMDEVGEIQVAGEEAEDEESEESEESEGMYQPLRLEGCELVTELNGLIFDQLPLTLRLRLKRTPIRAVVIKRQSSQFLRYEMFKRLNTGGSKLSDQDIRNVNARMIGRRGTDFYRILMDCAQFQQFKHTIEFLSPTLIENRADEELILRFFATMDFRNNFRGNVGDWLDAYMEAILIHNFPFGEEQISKFRAVFTLLSEKFGANAFLKYRHGQPQGGVAPAYFEAVAIGALNSFNHLSDLTPERATELLSQAVESDAFRRVTGPGANSLPKLQKRITIITEAFASV